MPKREHRDIRFELIKTSVFPPEIWGDTGRRQIITHLAERIVENPRPFQSTYGDIIYTWVLEVDPPVRSDLIFGTLIRIRGTQFEVWDEEVGRRKQDLVPNLIDSKAVLQLNLESSFGVIQINGPKFRRKQAFFALRGLLQRHSPEAKIEVRSVQSTLDLLRELRRFSSIETLQFHFIRANHQMGTFEDVEEALMNRTGADELKIEERGTDIQIEGTINMDAIMKVANGQGIVKVQGPDANGRNLKLVSTDVNLQSNVRVTMLPDGTVSKDVMSGAASAALEELDLRRAADSRQ